MPVDSPAPRGSHAFQLKVLASLLMAALVPLPSSMGRIGKMAGLHCRMEIRFEQRMELQWPTQIGTPRESCSEERCLRECAGYWEGRRASQNYFGTGQSWGTKWRGQYCLVQFMIFIWNKEEDASSNCWITYYGQGFWSNVAAKSIHVKYNIYCSIRDQTKFSPNALHYICS